MKYSILLAGPMAANAFVSPSSTSSLTQQQQRHHDQQTTRLSLLPLEPAAAIESASFLTAVDGGSVVDTLGSLALLGSVGFGVFMGKSNNPDWSYEYKPTNDAFSSDGDLALLEESPGSVLEKVEEDSKPSATAAQQTFFGASSAPAPAPAKKASPPKKAKAAATTSAPSTPAKKSFFGNKGPSKELLESTEKAKAAVAKAGVKETQDKISSKNEAPAPSPTPIAVKVASTSTSEVAETKQSGGKRRVAKGVALIVAAGAVAAARNVVKAYLGRGML